ncbi:TIGR04086 family membrane protein [Paratissierella segnis]|jgi:putative membrane protein (TIGR04086 family)|uniref:TIGR04086 family membrane protein n=1 Tax=Paratissierella segnis TaxID=2763679 RepID=A0A926IFN4_9FIRM|nr:TIGR04086 family membrane protein [Paratissierella segnis]MBC8588687.1 TIGR04086 family membrane protein [Paratissierella segnis]
MKSKGNGISIKYLAKGLLIALIFSIIFIIIISFLLRFTSLRESKVSLFNNIAMILSIAIGSIYISFKVKENGWLNGGILGLLYYLVIIFLNVVFFRNLDTNALMLTKLILSTFSGIIGGIIGINIR